VKRADATAARRTILVLRVSVEGMAGFLCAGCELRVDVGVAVADDEDAGGVG
jgi:hypothetical protein